MIKKWPGSKKLKFFMNFFAKNAPFQLKFSFFYVTEITFMKKFEWVKNIVNWVKTGHLYGQKWPESKNCNFYELFRE